MPAHTYAGPCIHYVPIISGRLVAVSNDEDRAKFCFGGGGAGKSLSLPREAFVILKLLIGGWLWK
jgi:hypothetical protein